MTKTGFGDSLQVQHRRLFNANIINRYYGFEVTLIDSPDENQAKFKN